MYKIDNQKFGALLVSLRKEKGFTQRELAERLYVSDKAVSKWERGLSLPDISLLAPLAEVLGVTVTELLRGERMDGRAQMDIREVEDVVTAAIGCSAEERRRVNHSRRGRGILFALCAAAALTECMLFWLFGVQDAVYWEDTLLVVSLFTVFGGWFSLFAPEVLPGYYDQNRISAFSSGIFRMNLPGVRFHNGNWPYILRTGRLWCLIVLALFPALYFGVRIAFLQLLARQLLAADVWWWIHLLVLFPSTLGLLAAMTVAGIRHK